MLTICPDERLLIPSPYNFLSYIPNALPDAPLVIRRAALKAEQNACSLAPFRPRVMPLEESAGKTIKFNNLIYRINNLICRIDLLSEKSKTSYTRLENL